MALKKQKKSSLLNTKRKLIAKLSPKSPISEQYRTIRTNIQFSSVDRPLRSLMITSSGPAEGKSTTTANLAVVFAQQGKKVLLTDADLRKPTVHYTFGMMNTVGLTNVLSKQTTLTEAIQSSDVDNLDILASGPIPPNPAELLSSGSMENFLANVYERYDIVLFDTPPVTAVTDAQVLANQCDGTILVISSGSTENEQAIKAKDLLEASKTKLIGVVLNNKKMNNSQYYYYYGSK
ncbi:CpsD/CapB family tyrosine-protein kinase [Falsibacillus pallidus]|uniref:non-specific protein-tyrosine kinase n=1 Tax=Falsibacillus pallidus TaxID=493781 RepID=A0A370GEL3_9BACI|nr:CpsD/CapB family tyrosine-protein kinase [Falsibacillus pallidus]RDI41646.1 capsular exopolysaccharide synthesis family protein [Falsibacillus pallidus]